MEILSIIVFKFFKSDSEVSLESWGDSNEFKSETPAKLQLRSEYDHLVYFSTRF